MNAPTAFVRRLRAFPALLIAAALTSTAEAQPLSSTEWSRLALSVGAERRGLFFTGDVALSDRVSIGYSATDRFDEDYQPRVSSTSTGARTRAVALGATPVRWFTAYAGPALAKVRSTSIPADGVTRPTPLTDDDVPGAVLGGTLRLHDRPYRFYSVRVHAIWLPGQHTVERLDISVGFGMGIAF